MDETRPAKGFMYAILAICVVGAVLAADLTYVKFQLSKGDPAYQSFCNISAEVNCDRVAQSEWSTLFGVPISVFGMATYALLAGLALRRGRLALALIAWISLASVGYSAVLAYVSAFKIGSLCLMCVGLYVVNLALAVLSLIGLKKLVSPAVISVRK